jgi:general secretion pathway protein D
MTLRLISAASTCAMALAWTVSAAAQSAPAPAPSGGGDHVSATIVPGSQTFPMRPELKTDVKGGDVELNFPHADVRELAKLVLRDTLHLNYDVDPAVNARVDLVTPKPIARSELLNVFEQSLSAAKLALVRRGGTYVIVAVAKARAEVKPVADTAGDSLPGFGAETVTLRFIAAAELKKLIDGIAPDTVTVTDPTRNIVTLTGPQGQRRSVRELIAQLDVDWLKGMSFGLYVPKNTDSRIIGPEIDKLLNGPGAPSAGLVRLIVMDRINGILAVSAQQQYLQDVQRWIEVLDREGVSNERRLFVYRVQNGRSADLAASVNKAFGVGGGQTPVAPTAGRAPSDQLDARPPPLPAPGSAAGARPADTQSAPSTSLATITSDETNNAVLVFGTPREYAVVEDALRKLDVAPVQVLIEAAVTEVSLTHDLRFGVQWNFHTGNNELTLLPNTGTVSSPASGVDPLTTSPADAIANAGRSLPGFNYLFINTGTITATLNALSGLTNVNVLSAPKMLVLNNHTASLQVGDQVPIVTASSVSTVGTNAPLVNSVDYRDTGVILKVTPRVNSGGLVLLDVAQEVSDVTLTSTSSINSPTIQQRKFATSIAIQDGQTIALGGLIRDTRGKSRSGVPVLSSIPVLGALAGTQGTQESRTELLILLTPRVVRSAPDASAVTDDLRSSIQALEPLPPVKSFRP